MVRRIGFGDGRTSASPPRARSAGVGRQVASRGPAAPPDARPRTASEPAPREQAKARPAPAFSRRRRPLGGPLGRPRLALGAAIAAAAAHWALARIGGVAALVYLPEDLAAGRTDFATALTALAPPFLIGAAGLWLVARRGPATARQKSQTDRARFEAPRPADARRAAEALRRARPGLAESAEPKSTPTGCLRLVLIGALLLWISLWSVGLWGAAQAFLRATAAPTGWADAAGLGLWLAVAGAAWLVAAAVLGRLLRG